MNPNSIKEEELLEGKISGVKMSTFSNAAKYNIINIQTDDDRVHQKKWIWAWACYQTNLRVSLQKSIRMNMWIDYNYFKHFYFFYHVGSYGHM